MTQRRNVDRLTSEMEELFADLWYHRLAPQRRGFRPRVDVYRTAEPAAIHVVAELPGIDPEQVDVAVNDGVLVISGHRQRPHNCADAAEATYEHGLLTISLPMRQRKPGPVRVPVREGETE